MSQELSAYNGVGGLVLIVFLIVCSCCICYVRRRRKRCRQQTEQGQPRRSNSMVYSVTMQDDNGSSFYNAVTEYLRNSQTDQADIDLTVRERQLNGNFIDGKMLAPQGLPSYDDVISGKFDGNIEPPPPYSQEANCNSVETNNQS